MRSPRLQSVPGLATSPPAVFITIVSGLPRSGTSLMMGMLQAAGVPLLTDHRRRADVSNPLGYFEYEPVKRLAADASWLAQAEGKAVKIVSSLLTNLPAGRPYKIIFMRRRLPEIVASQNRMLKRTGCPAAPEPSDLAAERLSRHLRLVTRWLRAQPEVEVLSCNYHAILRRPRFVADKIAVFLGLNLDTDRMAAVVDPTLYRVRRSAG